MINLLEETKQELKDVGKTLNDIKWVSWHGRELPIENFVTVADKQYDNGYGSNEVSMSLLVVGDDWWLERHEYDGSEWWEYKTLPVRPKEAAYVTKEAFWKYPPRDYSFE